MTRDEFDVVVAYVWNSVCALERIEGADRVQSREFWFMRLLSEMGKAVDDRRISARTLARYSRIAAVVALAMHGELRFGEVPDPPETVR